MGITHPYFFVSSDKIDGILRKTMKYILVTGSTGDLGSCICEQLALREDYHLLLLVRAQSLNKVRFVVDSLEMRGRKIDSLRSVKSRVTVFCGDIRRENFGLKVGEYSRLVNLVDEVYHAAAEIGFNLTLEEVRNTNVGGCENIVAFIKDSNKVSKLHYISTTFVLGDSEKTLAENSLDLGQRFNNSYERSKYEAEKYLSRSLSGDANIFRTSILTGKFEDGSIKNFKLLYEAMRLFSRGVVEIFPGSKRVRHNIIPVDIAAMAIVLIAESKCEPSTYHIISPNTVNCYDLLKNAAKYFGYCNPRWIKPSEFKSRRISSIQRRIIEPFVPFFLTRADIALTIRRKFSKTWDLQFPRSESTMSTGFSNT